jgi:hypothetical protein
MKLYIPKPINWFGPYQLAETLCFWAKEEDEYGFEHPTGWVHKFGTFLAGENHDTVLSKAMTWYDGVRRKYPWNKTVVHIDYWDTWSLDQTLSPVILPMLKQLKATKHGSGMVDLEDVPEHLRTTSNAETYPQLTFDFYTEDPEEGVDVHDRYEWVLDEMIWAFEQIQPDSDWEEQYWITKPKMDWEHMKQPFEEGENTREVKWLVKGECDWVGRAKHQERINNGLRLFGKYYQTLWD